MDAMPTPRTQEAKAVFKAVDTDGDGQLSLAEMQSKCSDFGMDDMEIQQLFLAMDVDASGAVDLGEFIAGYRHLMMFRRLDKDHDGGAAETAHFRACSSL